MNRTRTVGILLEAVTIGRQVTRGLMMALADAVYCPRCGQKSLEVVPATGRVFCLYAATCGYSS